MGGETVGQLREPKKYKYLAIIIDSKLKWEYHLNYVNMRLRKMGFLFKLLSDILNLGKIKKVYCALVQPIIRYGPGLIRIC